LVPVLNAEKRVELLLFSLNDVSQRKRAEIELERFFELSVDMFCILNLDEATYLRSNPAFEKTLGIKSDELIGRPFIERIHPDDQAEVLAQIVKLRNGEYVGLSTNRHICVDGSYKWLRWNCVPVLEEGLVYAVARDVTDELKMQDEMIRLERLKLVGEMAACIGHEVRNPITAVRAFIQLLQAKAQFKSYQAHFNMVLSELDRTHAIISRFLSLAKDKPIELRLENLNQILEELTPLIRASANEAGIKVRLDLKPIREVMVDRTEICQLVLNMTRNSIDAMTSGGSLTVKTQMEGTCVVLEVQDEGTGISPEVLNKIGTPFFTTKENGTGLGMAICHSIMARHGGQLRIQTSASGTTMLMSFPKAQVQETGCHSEAVG
jgi:PAS domain S-box-containing protein